MGRTLRLDVLAAVQGLYLAERQRFVGAQLPIIADAAYGDDPRQRLDLYAPARGAGPTPVLLCIHGGGFIWGEKRSDAHPFNAHVGRWAARPGC